MAEYRHSGDFLPDFEIMFDESGTMQFRSELEAWKPRMNRHREQRSDLERS